jgi:hypothetical protein
MLLVYDVEQRLTRGEAAADPHQASFEYEMPSINARKAVLGLFGRSLRWSLTDGLVEMP